MSNLCPKCGAEPKRGDGVCRACGTPLATAAEPSAPVQAFGGSSLAEPRNLARIAQIVALLGFVLPWITVSCQGRVLAQVSGFDMALGRVTIRNPFTDVTQVHAGSPNVPVVIALVLIVAGLALSFNLSAARIALVNAAASAAALLLVAYEILVSARGAVRSEAAASQSGDGLERSFAEAIRVATGSGFWITCAALAAAAFFYWRAHATRRAAAAPLSKATPQVRSNAAPGDPPG